MTSNKQERPGYADRVGTIMAIARKLFEAVLIVGFVVGIYVGSGDHTLHLGSTLGTIGRVIVGVVIFIVAIICLLAFFVP